MAPIVFLDTETTGIHPEREVWEVGMIRRDEDGEREIQFFVDVDLDKADPFGLAVGRFYERHPLGLYLSGSKGAHVVGDSWLRSSAAREIARWTHGAHIVGAVPSFDTISLDALMRAEKLAPAWHYHLIDIESMAVGWLYALIAEGWIKPDGEAAAALTLPYKYQALQDAIGLPEQKPEDQHTALGDARRVAQIWDVITA